MLPNCTATFFSLSLQPNTGDDDDDVDGCCFCCCCCFFKISSFTYYTLTFNATQTTLAHILTLHDLHFFFKPRNKNFPPSREISFLPIHTVGNTASFQISRRRGGKSRDPGSGGGNFILEKIFTSPGLNPIPILLPRTHKKKEFLQTTGIFNSKHSSTILMCF